MHIALHSVNYALCSHILHYLKMYVILRVHFNLEKKIVLGASEITANLYCNFVYLYCEGCVICIIYLR